MDANNGKITINITGGEKQYSSTIIMTGDAITCVTHTFNVLAEESINMFAGEQKSSIVMNKEQIAITNNEQSSITLTKPTLTIQSLMIMENAKTLLKMDAAMIMENCKAGKSSGTGETPAAQPTTTIGAQLTAQVQNFTSNITNNLVGNFTQNFTGIGNILNNFGNIGNMLGNLNIGNMLGNLNISNMLGNLDIGNMLGKLNIGNMLGNLGDISGILQKGIDGFGLDKISGLCENFNLGNLGDLKGIIGGATDFCKNLDIGNIIKLPNISIPGINIPNISNISKDLLGGIKLPDIGKITEPVTSAIENVTAPLNKGISNITETVNKSIGKVGTTITNLAGKAKNGIEKVTSSIPKIENIDPTNLIIHMNASNDVNAHSDQDIDEYIIQQNQIIHNIVYNNTSYTDEEKQALYEYYTGLYNFAIYITELYNIFIYELPIIYIQVVLLEQYLIDAINYINIINQIVLDFVNNTTKITINQIIHDLKDRQIYCLQLQQFVNKNMNNDTLKKEINILIDDYLNNYLSLNENLITLIKQLSNIKIDLEETIILTGNEN